MEAKKTWGEIEQRWLVWALGQEVRKEWMERIGKSDPEAEGREGSLAAGSRVRYPMEHREQWWTAWVCGITLTLSAEPC